MKQTSAGTYVLQDRWADHDWLDDLLATATSTAPDGVLEVGCDVETKTARSNAKQPNPRVDTLVGIGIAITVSPDKATPAIPIYGLAADRYVDVLQRHLPSAGWFAHNAMFDATVMRRYGIKLGEHRGDPRIIAYLLGEPDADLKSLLTRWLQIDVLHYEEVLDEWGASDISQVPVEVQADYCALQDAGKVIELARVMELQLPDRSKDVYTGIELPMVTILVEMSHKGIRFDRELAQPILQRELEGVETLDSLIRAIVKKSGFSQLELRNGAIWNPTCRSCRNGSKKRVSCTECGGAGKLPPVEREFNPGSADQLRAWLYDYLGAPIRRYAGGRTEWQARQAANNGVPLSGGTDGLALLQLKDFHEAIPLILSRRKFQKRTGYIGKWMELSELDGRLHTQFRNTTVVSGRLSSSEPNLMQVTQDLRSMMTADL